MVDIQSAGQFVFECAKEGLTQWEGVSMKWVEMKMKELGVLSHPDYKVTAMVDHLAMITVQSESHKIFDCKPLGVIWGKCPEVGIQLLSLLSPRTLVVADFLSL